MERIEGLVRKGQAIVAAQRTSSAFHDGKVLTDEYRDWERSLFYAPGEAPGTISDADRSTVAYIMARWPRRPAEVS